MQKTRFHITLEITDECKDDEILDQLEDIQLFAEDLVGTELDLRTERNKRFLITEIVKVEEAPDLDYKKRIAGALIGAAMSKQKKKGGK